MLVYSGHQEQHLLTDISLNLWSKLLQGLGIWWYVALYIGSDKYMSIHGLNPILALANVLMADMAASTAHYISQLTTFAHIHCPLPTSVILYFDHQFIVCIILCEFTVRKYLQL